MVGSIELPQQWIKSYASCFKLYIVQPQETPMNIPLGSHLVKLLVLPVAIRDARLEE